MIFARELETGMHMAPTPLYPRDMVKIIRVSRTSFIIVKIELTDGSIQYLDPRCLVHVE